MTDQPLTPPSVDERVEPIPSGIVTRGVLFLFSLSGATALLYEVLWMRALGLVFGHTVLAITTVLAVFMLGLSLGSAVLGRLARLARSPLCLYGTLEAGIGLSALAVPSLIDAVAPITLRLVAAETSPLMMSLTQFALVISILLLPTALMGGTLPVLMRLTGERTEALGVRAGTLYAANTLGAVAGVAAAGFLLLPALGNRRTGLLAVAANLAVAGVAWALGRSASSQRRSAFAGVEPAPGGEAPSGARRAALAALAVSGAIAMASEAAWSRALTLVIGSSTYAFTAMLLAFLLGIGLGSAAYVARAPQPTLRLLGGLQFGAAGAGALALLAFRGMPDLFLWGFALSDAPAAIQALQVGLCMLILLPTTCAFGATFPCAVALAARPRDHAAGAVGTPYAINTLGAIAGTVAAGFVLIPNFGAEGTLRAAVAGSAVLAFVLVAGESRASLLNPRLEVGVGTLPAPRRRWVAAALAGGTALAAVALPGWDRQLLASGVAIYGNTYLSTPGGLPAIVAGERLLYYHDGPGATVSVHENARGRFLRINGKTDASTGDMQTQLMLGHLPLLLHPGAKDVLVIGLGSGITAAAVLRHPVRGVDVVEIEPAVVKAAHFFTQENRAVLADPRLRLHLADARRFLLATPTHYDVIISEPSNPWIGGIASLFTREFFALAQSHLHPEGVMVQWVHGYGLAPEDLRMVVRTFRTIFPAATLWGPTGADYLLVGAPGLLRLDLTAIGARVTATPGLGEDLEGIGFSAPLTLLADFLLGEADLVRYAGPGPVNTDDWLPLEFSAPRSLYRETTTENRRQALAARRDETLPLAGIVQELNAAPARHAIAVTLLRRGQHDEALLYLERALACDPGYLPARLDRAKVFLVLGRIAQAQVELEAVLTDDPGQADAAFTLGTLLVAEGDLQQAATRYRQAVTRAPGIARYRAGLAGLYLRLGEFANAETEYRAALALVPEDPTLRKGLALAVTGGRRAYPPPTR